jgi:hypothetical protein
MSCCQHYRDMVIAFFRKGSLAIAAESDKIPTPRHKSSTAHHISQRSGLVGATEGGQSFGRPIAPRILYAQPMVCRTYRSGMDFHYPLPSSRPS